MVVQGVYGGLVGQDLLEKYRRGFMWEVNPHKRMESVNLHPLSRQVSWCLERVWWGVK